MNKSIKLLFLLSVILSCDSKNEGNYDFISYRLDGLKIWSESIPKEFKGIEEGTFELKYDGSLMSKGNYKNGFKVGEWMYHTSDSTSVNLNWDQYVNERKQFEINYVSSWEIHESDERPFQATFPTKSDNLKDKYFIIHPYSIEEIGMSKREYWELYRNKMFGNEAVSEYAFFELVTEQSTYYFSRGIIERDDESLLILNFIGDFDGQIYDITYSSLNERYHKKHVLFFDMVRSVQIGGQRFFSPYFKTKGMRELSKEDAKNKATT